PVPYIDFTQSRLPLEGFDEILDLVEMLFPDGDLALLKALVGPVFGPNGLVIDTGLEGESIFLDFDQEIIQVKVEYIEGDILGLLQIAGSMAFTKRGGEQVIDSNGDVRTVTSLAVGINNVYGFVGLGGYWGRNPDTNRIDGSVRDDTAIGVAVDNLKIGAVFMMDFNLVDPGVFFAVDASLDMAGLVGTEEFLTAEIRNLMVEINQGLTFDLSVIDFSRSTYRINDDGSVDRGIWEPGVELEEGFQIGYFLDTGDINNPIILNYDSRLIRLQGEAEFNLLDLAVLEVVFEIKLTDQEFTLFMEGEAFIAGFLEAEAMVLVVIDSRGLAAHASLTNFNLSVPGISLNVDILELIVNTTGEIVVFNVPQEFQDFRGLPPTIEISNIPPGRDSAVPFYFSVKGEGELVLLDTLVMEGGFSFLMSYEGETLVNILNFDMVMSLPMVGSVGVAGTLGILLGPNGGVYGSFQFRLNADFALFQLEGDALYQINTTNVEQTVQTLDIDDSGNVIGTKNTTVDALTLLIVVGGRLNVAGLIELVGRAELQISAEGFEGYINMMLDLSFAQVQVEGAFAILDKAEGPVLALGITFALNLNLGPVGKLQGTAVLQINTGSEVFTRGGITIAPQTYFLLDIDGSLILFDGGVTLSGEILILVDENGFFLEFEGSLSLLAILTAEAVGTLGYTSQGFFGAVDVVVA
ncbi:MAG: hypothetical protein PF795_13680, partial [Kiritimatiellae bacterium]|nr:hypothetical protein [Kiritimatiellia bacterium]